MSTPEIIVSYENPSDASGRRNANACLLTPELERMIRNQNIETSDINSMKWPLFGLSRHAVCKLLMLRTDLLKMLSEEDDIAESAYRDRNEFRIWFRCTDDPADEGQVFTRMHMAKVTPLMVTGNGYIRSKPRTDENGDPVLDGEGNQIVDEFAEGEALYIVEFRCDRWWWSSMRKFNWSDWGTDSQCEVAPNLIGSSKWHTAWIESHNIGETNAFNLSLDALVSGLLQNPAYYGCGLGDIDIEDDSVKGFFRKQCQDVWDASFGGYARSASSNFERNRPIVEIIDELCRESRAFISYRQVGSIAVGIQGRYEFAINDVDVIGSGNFGNFMRDHGDSIIAGAVSTEGLSDNDFSDPNTNYPDMARWPRMVNLDPISLSAYSYEVASIHHRASIPDGRPPRAFPLQSNYLSAYGDTTLSPHNMNLNTLVDVFSEHFPHDFTFDAFPLGDRRPIFINAKKFPSAFIDRTNTTTARESQRRNRGDGYSWYYDPNSTGSEFWKLGGKPHPLHPVDVAQKHLDDQDSNVARKGHHACDIWLNKWWMPADDEIWQGAAWIELRIQTDKDGFGFPTTRIWSDWNDPMFVSVPDDKPLDIRATGLAKTWRDTDGKTRVHVPWPFGIPCLIKIIGLDTDIGSGGQFNNNIKAWAYKAKLVIKGQGGNDESWPKRFPPIPDSNEFFGQLVDWEDDVDGGSNDPERYITAYNLAELANTTTFSSPGYKMPLAQAGFDVLPIGKDRDGAFHEVIVQAMVYWSDERYDPVIDEVSGLSPAQRGQAPMAYFCLSNAVDGDCPSPLTQDTILDGGEY